VKYSILNNEITFTIGEINKPMYRYISIVNLNVDIQLIDNICGSICRNGQGKSVYTQSQYIHNNGKALIYFFIHKGISNPTSSSDWQSIILEFLNFYISANNFSKATLSTKIEIWHTRITAFLNILTDDGVIPVGLIIPNIKLQKESSRTTFKKTLQNTLPQKTSTLDKLLIDTSFALDDEMFLDKIEASLRRQVSILKTVCLQHWEAIVADNNLFKKYTEHTEYSEINTLFEPCGRVVNNPPKKFSLICNNESTEGCIWTILIIRKLLLISNNTDCISNESLAKLPYFHSRPFNHKQSLLLSPVTSLKTSAFNILNAPGVFHHFCGVLSGADVAAICTLLTIEHPNFNPMSLQDAKLVGVKGKMHLITTDDNEISIFSIDKPRATKRKSAVLTLLSQKIILSIINITQPLRNILKRNNNPDWRYLFLGKQNGGEVGKMKVATSDGLTCKKSRSLIRMYPELEKAGLTRGVLSLRKVRNTMGVLKWFETGSIQEMSKCLGNSYRVVLEHYIPSSLIEEWNTRIIRRFQNTLIILACKDEDFLLDVTDFTTMDELINFTSQLVIEYKKGTSPIANLIHIFSSELPDKKVKNEAAVLNINLSSNGIAYLYAFHEFTLKNIPQIDKTNQSSAISDSVQALMNLSSFIKHACETNAISPALRDIIDYESLLLVHSKALKLKDIILDKFDNMHLSHSFWSDDEK
jgi:hypothetical protein